MRELILILTTTLDATFPFEETGNKSTAEAVVNLILANEPYQAAELVRGLEVDKEVTEASVRAFLGACESLFAGKEAEEDSLAEFLIELGADPQEVLRKRAQDFLLRVRGSSSAVRRNRLRKAWDGWANRVCYEQAAYVWELREDDGCAWNKWLGVAVPAGSLGQGGTNWERRVEVVWGIRPQGGFKEAAWKSLQQEVVTPLAKRGLGLVGSSRARLRKMSATEADLVREKLKAWEEEELERRWEEWQDDFGVEDWTNGPVLHPLDQAAIEIAVGIVEKHILSKL